MRHKRAASFTALAAFLFLPFAGAPASAELPAYHVLLVRGATVESNSLPTLLSLPTGIYSANELAMRFRNSAFRSNDLLALTTTNGSVRRIDETGFVLPSNDATYYDPVRRTSYAARAIPGAPGGAQLSLIDGRTDSIANLLSLNGSVLVFPIPEPGFAFGLAIGAITLAGLRRPTTRPQPHRLQKTKGTRASTDLR